MLNIIIFGTMVHIYFSIEIYFFCVYSNCFACFFSMYNQTKSFNVHKSSKKFKICIHESGELDEHRKYTYGSNFPMIAVIFQ